MALGKLGLNLHVVQVKIDVKLCYFFLQIFWDKARGRGGGERKTIVQKGDQLPQQKQ